MKKLIIAIDGHSSTGKSTFAKAIAKALDYTYLDSGALYRAVTLYALEKGLFSENGTPDTEALTKEIPHIRLAFHKDPHTGENHTFLNDVDVEQEIRSPRVTARVSPISVIPQVRDLVDKHLRQWGEAKGIVMDGRDIGTAVFPQAEVKIFMTAPAEIRAQRRLAEWQEKGREATFEEVLENIRQRDHIDSTRAVNPLKMAPDALLLDNGSMTVEEQMVWFKKTIQEKWDITLK
ncbi:MAG: (d)CMP kinase [Bacteroidales bacterium]|jgi:cytidylate kinase